MISLVTAASSLLNSKEARKEFDKEKVKKVRDLMVKKLAEIKAESLPMITEQCNAFSAAIENKNEVTPKAQVLLIAFRGV